jgi:mono/diheme cytochrome c family protein
MPEHHSRRLTPARIVKAGWVFFCLLFVAACHLDMYDQPKYGTYETSEFFPDGAAARALPPNTVSRSANLNAVVTTGKENDQFVAKVPIAIDDTVLARGKDRYNIVCGTCHGANLDGKGLVASYFKPQPPSFYAERLRTAPDGYLFNVITWGKGQMYPQAYQLSAEDRWAIVAYIRQMEQNPPQGVVANPTATPVGEPRPAGTVQPNQPEWP